MYAHLPPLCLGQEPGPLQQPPASARSRAHHATAKLHFRLLVPLLTIAQLAAIVIIQHYAL